MRYVQYYNENKVELCGSDSVWVFDQRCANRTMILQVKDSKASQWLHHKNHPDKYCPQRAAYFRIVQGESLMSEATPLTEFIPLLHN